MCDIHPFTRAQLAAFKGDAKFLRTSCKVEELLEPTECLPSHTPLELALVNGHFEAARCIWELSGPQHIQDDRYLYQAIKKNRVELVRWLFLECNYRPIFRLEQIWTKVHSAELVRILGSDPTWASIGIRYYARQESLDFLKILVEECKGKLLYPYYMEMRRIHVAGMYERTMNHLLDAGGIDLFNFDNDVLVDHAIWHGLPNLVRRLLFDFHLQASSGQLYVVCQVHPLPNFMGSDYALEICEMLLEAGANPWFDPSTNMPLVDSIAAAKVPYVIEDNRIRLIQLLKKHMARWSPERHVFFPQSFKKRVFTVLLWNRRYRIFPRDVLFAYIFPAMAYNEAHEGRLKEKTCRELRSILQKQHHIKAPKKKRKVELVESIQREESKGIQSCILPNSRLIVTQNGQRFMNTLLPTDVPWVHIGRAPIFKPSGGATLTVDLAGAAKQRSISRLHVTLRYSLERSQWEIHVHGRNSIRIGEQDYYASPNWIPLVNDAFEMQWADLHFRIETSRE